MSGLNIMMLVMSDSIEGFFEMVDNINKFVIMIISILDQINLLVLNVVIEVVCVGDVGCGFSVVVDEVCLLVNEINKLVSEVFELVKSII